MAKKPDPLESEWQSVVTQQATMLGWRWWHFHDSRRQVGSILVGDKDAAGFPDLVLAHRELGVGLVELKRGKSHKPTEKQIASNAALAHAFLPIVGRDPRKAGEATVFVHLWRPDDLTTVVMPALRGDPVPFVYGWGK